MTVSADAPKDLPRSPPAPAADCAHNNGTDADADADAGAAPPASAAAPAPSDPAAAPQSQWPTGLRTALAICQASPLGVVLLVGPAMRCFFNEAARCLIGADMPGPLGAPLAQAWPDAGVVEHVACEVLRTGAAVRKEDLELAIMHDGVLQQRYFTMACTPLNLGADGGPGPDGPAGVFVVLIDTTARVLSERRQRTLNDLATGVVLRRGDAAILERVREVLAHNRIDLPLTALYLDAGNGCAEQRFCTGLHEGCAGLAKRIGWGVTSAHPLSALADSFDAIEFDDATLLTLDDTCGVFHERPRRLLALPFMAPGHGHPFGFLLVALNPRALYDADYRHFIDTTAAVVATAVASVQAERLVEQEELKMLYQRLQAVREGERNALAREVHDQLGQTLSAAKIDLKLLQQDAHALQARGAELAPPHIVTELQSACDTLDRAVQQVRDIARELRAPELDVQGVYAAIEWHARDFEKRTRIAVKVAISVGLLTPPRPMGEALLRIVQEALTNVLRHASARQVWISIDARGAALLLRVRDDGVGVGLGMGAGGLRQASRTSLGITGMRERAELAGGRLNVRALRPAGTLVSALLPLAPLAPLVSATAPRRARRGAL